MSKWLWMIASIALGLAAYLLVKRDDSAFPYFVGYAKYRLGISRASDPHIMIDVPLDDGAFIRRRWKGLEVVGSEPAAWIVIRDREGKTVDNFSIGLNRRNVPIFFGGLPSGDYQIIGRLPNSLSWSKTVHFDTRFAQQISPNWRLGDVDGDDRITDRDVAVIQRNSGRSVPQLQRKSLEQISAADLDLRIGMDRTKNCDLDGDGIIDGRDLDLVFLNMGRLGEAKMPWSDLFLRRFTPLIGTSVSVLGP